MRGDLSLVSGLFWRFLHFDLRPELFQLPLCGLPQQQEVRGSMRFSQLCLEFNYGLSGVLLDRVCRPHDSTVHR